MKNEKIILKVLYFAIVFDFSVNCEEHYQPQKLT